MAANLPVYQPDSYKKPEVWEEFRALKPDLQVMAFVTLFVPEDFLNIPTHGSIQYHPSLLPAYRGASAINWPIIKGEKETGLSIFWPDNGLDTGDVLIQKKTPISATDTLGTVYFDRLFPMGVEAMLEGVDLVKAGKAPRIKQDESEGDLRGPLRPRQCPHRLGQAVGADRPADPRLQSGARRLVDARRQDRQDLRRQADAGEETRRASPASSARSSRSKPTASRWSAPTGASRSRACRPMGRRSAPANGPRPPTSRPARASHDCIRRARARRASSLLLSRDWMAGQPGHDNGQLNSLLTDQHTCPPRSISHRNPTSKSPRPPSKRPHPRRREGKARHRGREPRTLWPLQGQGVDGLRQVAQGQEERQADPGHGDLADAGGRRQDDDHRRPHRCAQPHRQEGDAVPARAFARAVRSA